MKYAENTSVDSGRSRNEIERTLTRYGASGFVYGWTTLQATIMFEMRGRRVRFDLPMPDRNSDEFTRTAAGRIRKDTAAIEIAYERAVRQRWRALALVIKAKLEAVESGITMFEDEFLAHILLPNGKTVGQYMIPQIDQVYSTGTMPPMLPDLSK